jgi:folate-binding protein YgfZ
MGDLFRVAMMGAFEDHNSDMSDAFTIPTPHLELQGAAPLNHLGIIRCLGEDAVTFLHNQLTQDVQLLPITQARWSGYCNAQGRLQASFVVYKKAADEVWLIIRRDLLARTLKRLSMFVLRAKVKLNDHSDQQAVWGLSGQVMQALGLEASPPWSAAELPQGTVIALYPVGSEARALLLPRAQMPLNATFSQEAWLAGEVLAGVADVQESTFEAFVPQMLNHESVGGVNFKKGCYPGQEVVARSQFRGTLKRRTFLFATNAPVKAGAEVASGADVVGVVAQAATLPDQTGVALVCLLIQRAQDAELNVQGVGMRMLPLPYPLLQDI